MRCWPGCLAIITQGLNVGKIVTCVEIFMHEKWVIKSNSPMKGFSDLGKGPMVDVFPGDTRVLVCEDSQLRPILPPPGSETVKDEEDLKCSA